MACRWQNIVYVTSVYCTLVICDFDTGMRYAVLDGVDQLGFVPSLPAPPIRDTGTSGCTDHIHKNRGCIES